MVETREDEGVVREAEVLIKLPPRMECRFIERLNRFVLKVEVEGRERLGYINNTGRLYDVLVPGRTAYCLKKSGGRTDYRVFSISMGRLGALIDTGFQMIAFEKMVEKKAVPWLVNCDIVKRNPRSGKSLLDYMLDCGTHKLLLELKSAVLEGENKCAMYPDCPSLRGRRHIEELTKIAEYGRARAGIVFVAALPGAKCFTPNEKGDPEIPILLRKAWNKGVMIKAVSLHYDPLDNIIRLESPDLPVILNRV